MLYHMDNEADAPVCREGKWTVGMCGHCLEPLDPAEVGTEHVCFCSSHCRKQAEDVRYVRRAIREGRNADPKTMLVLYSNKIPFLAWDLAYTRPRIADDRRRLVLSQNGGLCVNCNERQATEVDHIKGGSTDLSNLQGLCRLCHELKPRGPIPEDLTRGGSGAVDASEQAQEILRLWKSALKMFSPLSDAPWWSELRECAKGRAGTRFGWITEQILCDEPFSPAHDDVRWRKEWRGYRRKCLEWAKAESAARDAAKFGRGRVGMEDPGRS